MPRHKYLRRQGDVWYVELVVPTDVSGKIFHGDESVKSRRGKPRKKFSKSLQTSNFREALDKSHYYLAQWFKEIANTRQMPHHFHPIGRSSINDKPLDSYLDEWLEFHRYSKGNEIVARRLIKHEISGWFSKFSDLSENNLKAWVKELEKGNSPSGQKLARGSIAQRISSMKAYIEYCIEYGLIEQCYVPTTAVLPKRSKTKANRRSILASSYHPFQKKELRQLLSAACTKRDKRLYYLIAIGMFTGCRISEICNLKSQCVDAKSFSVLDSKTYAGTREVPLHSALEPLMKFLKKNTYDDFIIPGLSSSNQQVQRSKGMIQKFSRLKKELGFGPEHGFHSFRSTIAHELENAGVNEVHAARILGHSVRSITYGLYSGKSDFDILYASFSALDLGINARHFEADLCINFSTAF